MAGRRSMPPPCSPPPPSSALLLPLLRFRWATGLCARKPYALLASSRERTRDGEGHGERERPPLSPPPVHPRRPATAAGRRPRPASAVAGVVHPNLTLAQGPLTTSLLWRPWDPAARRRCCRCHPALGNASGERRRPPPPTVPFEAPRWGPDTMKESLPRAHWVQALSSSSFFFDFYLSLFSVHMFVYV